MMASAMDIVPGRVTLYLNDPIRRQANRHFAAMVEQRQRRVPVSHIVGYRQFYGRSFFVSSDVLDPRPETECLIERALEEPFERVLDLGTGSGSILLTLLAECPDATGFGTDISVDALDIAQENPLMFDLSDRFDLEQSDWFDKVTGQFDLIVSNPPYVTQAEMADLQPEVRDHEPQIALTPGGDGLDAYRAITAGVMDHLAPGGRLIVEIGHTQADAVKGLFADAGLTEITCHKDLNGHDRVICGVKSVNNQR